MEVWKPYKIPQDRNPSQQQLFADLSKKPSIGILGYTVKSTFTVGMKKSNPDHQIFDEIYEKQRHAAGSTNSYNNKLQSTDPKITCTCAAVALMTGGGYKST